jgi:hypothetical protein
MSFESSQNSAAGENSTPLPINGHDIHCKAHYPHLIDATMCLWCTVIRVLRDEEQVYALSAYNNGYMDGYDEIPTIPLVEYINTYEEQCDVYVYTKDKRIIFIEDVRSEGLLDDSGFYVDHWFVSKRASVFVPRDDFSHLEYTYKQRDKVSKKEFDEMHSFIEEQLGDDLL